MIIVVMASVSELSAQDFAPSQQAQGYLDSKNVTVDHATGLFHYKVPIYTLKSGDFELPISLNYVGKGVRDYDLSGLIDYNWTLNVGGIVTRTVRGGMPDEISAGYISVYPYFDNFGTNYYTAAQYVNAHWFDGESDIFTAAFNGQSIDFIITKDGSDIIAEPLEKTNVKIECETSGDTITCWKITDENGNKYYFRQLEWCANVVQEDAVSTNGIRSRQPYVSSWHISLIEPRNAKKIEYNYLSEKNKDKYLYAYTSDFIYDENHPIKIMAMNFQNCTDRITAAINDVKEKVNRRYDLNYNELMKLDALKNYAIFSAESKVFRLYQIYQNDFFDQYNQINPADSIRQQHALNALLDLSPSLGGAIEMYEKKIDILLDNINNLQKINGTLLHTPESYSSLAGAIRTMEYLRWILEYINESDYIGLLISDMVLEWSSLVDVDTQSVLNGSRVKIESPLLDFIACGDNVVNLKYLPEQYYDYDDNNEWTSMYRYKLARLNIGGIPGNIVSIKIGDKQIQFLDNLGKVFERIKFEYYQRDYFSYHDIYGFKYKNKHLSSIREQYYSQDVDAEYAKMGSLSKITTSDGGELIVDYESNVVNHNNGLSRNYGGIRIKSLTQTDPTTNQTNSIKYHYPYPGELVFTDSYNAEAIQYNGFCDSVMHTRIKTHGDAFLNFGNNGVYYGYVEEEFVGKGKKTYLFLAPSRIGKDPHHPYRFWLNGLPLGMASYDKNGNLKFLTKNVYEVDFPTNERSTNTQAVSNVYSQGNWFLNAANSSDFSLNKLQIRAYEYDTSTLPDYSFFLSRPPTQEIAVGSGYYVTYDPYDHYYLPNIVPRKNMPLPEQRWTMLYGGKVLLKSQEEYRIEGNYSTASSINHFIASNLGTPFNKVEYFYDNIANSIAPTRIKTTDSRGDVYTSVTHRVVDMNVSGVIADMKTENILSPVVKQQTLIGNENKLLKEVVNVYGATLHNGKKYFEPAQIKTYLPIGNSTVTSFPSQEINLFTSGGQNHTTEQEITYKNDAEMYRPVSVTGKGHVSSMCYDRELDAPILLVDGYCNNCVDAINLCYYQKSITDQQFQDDVCSAISDEWIEVYQQVFSWMEHVERQNLSSEQQRLVNHEKYQAQRTMIYHLSRNFQELDFAEFRKYYESFAMSIWNYEAIGDFLYEVDRSVEQLYVDACILNISQFGGYLNKITFDWLFHREIYDDLHISVNSIQNPKMRLYVLSQNITTPISYSTIHSTGTAISTVAPVSKPYWNVQALDLDLGVYNGISSITINSDASIISNVSYLCLVPADCEFEATSYNADGTVFCKFDQTGTMERYEYDGAGRVTKVWDGNGKLLKENTYHINLP